MNNLIPILTLCVILLSACGGEDPSVSSGVFGDRDPTLNADSVFGEEYSGQYHLGPVDFKESEWHNACAPLGGYRGELWEATGLGGEFLAGVSNAHNLDGGVCDACIYIQTDEGRSIVARVVTYGVTNEPGDLDVSTSVFDVLNLGEYPRNMTWQFAACPNSGPMFYEFQTKANVWWTSLWVRNSKMPIVKVEVKSTNHTQFVELVRGGDGTFTDANGFGEGPFTLRITAMDGQVVEEQFDGFQAGALVESKLANTWMLPIRID